MGQVVLFRWGLVEFCVVVETRVHACAFEVRFRALSRLDFQCKNLYSKPHRETWTQFNTSFQWESMLSLWETHFRQRPSPKKILANLPKQSTDASADCAVQNDYASEWCVKNNGYNFYQCRKSHSKIFSQNNTSPRLYWMGRPWETVFQWVSYGKVKKGFEAFLEGRVRESVSVRSHWIFLYGKSRRHLVC